jgi:hypothetical protein
MLTSFTTPTESSTSFSHLIGDEELDLKIKSRRKNCPRIVGGLFRDNFAVNTIEMSKSFYFYQF